MKYRIVTVPGTDPVRYNVERWAYHVVGWFKKRRISGWVKVTYRTSWREYTFTHNEEFGSISEAQEAIAHWERVAANKTSVVAG